MRKRSISALISELSEDDSALPLSDMMAGLMLVFLLIAISLMMITREAQSVAEGQASHAQEQEKVANEKARLAEEQARNIEKQAEELRKTKDRLEKETEQINNLVKTWKLHKDAIYEALSSEFHEDFLRWNAEILREELTIRFHEPEVFFEKNSDEIQIKFRNILDDFFSRYVGILRKFSKEIDEVRIEGHTSSEWNVEVSELEAYFLNMDLSQRRTRSVLEYCIKPKKLGRNDVDWSKAHFVAVGMSSSRAVVVNGLEDRELSRRVEFRVVTHADRELAAIFEQISARRP